MIGQAAADIGLMRQVTQHWFRHLLATTMMALKASVRDGMDQGGWLTVESYMAYAHDVPEMRRAVVNQLPMGPGGGHNGGPELEPVATAEKKESA